MGLRCLFFSDGIPAIQSPPARRWPVRSVNAFTRCDVGSISYRGMDETMNFIEERPVSHFLLDTLKSANMF